MLRAVAVTLVAIGTALVNRMFRTHHPPERLEPGDRAPEFSLQGSDGRTYRLSELIGRSPVVLAWFPKAFTGG